jgi:1-acyl-sn-glycerol-3-phosphate acyltransferase
MSEKVINIEEAINSKNPKLLKWIPGFVLSYIKRVTHEQWLNDVYSRILHLHGIEFVNALIHEFELEVELIGEENLPKTGGVIIAANHPLGGMDGVAMMYAMGRVRSDIRFLVNDLLMTFRGFAPIFVPINKHGKNSQEVISRIDEVYSGDYAVLIFPAGLVSRKSEGGIQDLKWKKSFVSKAKKFKKDVIPCFIEGNNSKFFYNLGFWRKKLGIEANIEMFYLVDEMYKQRGKKVVIRIEKPIPYQNFDESKTDDQWAGYLKDKVYELGSKA